MTTCETTLDERISRTKTTWNTPPLPPESRNWTSSFGLFRGQRILQRTKAGSPLQRPYQTKLAALLPRQPARSEARVRTRPPKRNHCASLTRQNWALQNTIRPRYRPTTFSACRPFGPCLTSNSTAWPSLSDLYPSDWIAEKCTNTSSPDWR